MSAGLRPEVEAPNKPRWVSWLWAPAPAERLALFRLLVGLYAFVHMATQLKQQLSFARFSAAQFQPVGPAALLSTPPPAGLHGALVIVALLAALPFAAGWRYRFSAPLLALLYVWIGAYRSSWGMIFHTENLLGLHLIVLAAAPGAADALSFDARRRARLGLTPAEHQLPVYYGPEGQLGPSLRYSWPLALVSLETTLAYFVAGVAKLRNSGMVWIGGQVLRHTIADNNLRKLQLGVWHSPIGAYLVRFPLLWKLLAGLTVVFELGAPLALVHPFAAAGWSLLAWGFHVGVLATMAIVFGYPLCGVAFGSFFALERFAPLRWLAAKLRSPRALRTSPRDDRPGGSASR
jgi:hypothetical protein